MGNFDVRKMEVCYVEGKGGVVEDIEGDIVVHIPHVLVLLVLEDRPVLGREVG
jgi:hypothetical protein